MMFRIKGRGERDGDVLPICQMPVREGRVFRLAGLRQLLQRFPSVSAVLLLAGVMLVATVISTTVLLLELRQEELSHARGEVVTLTRVLSEQTARTFEGVSMTLRGVKERLSDDVGWRLQLDSEPVRLLLQARSASLPQVKAIFVVNDLGDDVNSSQAGFLPHSEGRTRSFFRYFAEGGTDMLFVGRPEISRVDGQRTFHVSTRLAFPDGRFRGVLVAAINVGYFDSLYEGVKLDFVSRLQLVDLDGVLMAGKALDALEFGKSSGRPKALEDLHALPPGQVIESREHFPDGLRLVAYRRAGEYPLAMRVAIDEHEALTPWRRVMRPIVGGVLAMLLFVLGTTFLLARNLVRKGALETALKESDEQLRAMVHSVKDAIVTVDSANRVVQFNRAAEHLFGTAAEDVIGQELGAALLPCLLPDQLQELLRRLEEGWNAAHGHDLLNILELARDGQKIPVELGLSVSALHGQKLLTAIFRDLTERRRSEAELLETNRQLQSLSSSLQNYREEERARIARELHDELGQLLTGIRMEVSWLGGRLQPEQGVLIDKIASVKGQIDRTIGTVRRISSELRPLVLDDLGFSAAASWFVDQFSTRTGLPVDLSLPDVDPERGDAVATALFRVLQESLTNVARHAHAGKVDVRLSHENDTWVLRVKDDGLGFVPEPGRPGDIGLVGMRERAQSLGGRFSVTSAPGRGTLVEIVIPARQSQEVQDWKK